MKKWIYIFLAVCLFCSCQEDDGVTFDATVGQDAFTFTPIPGGAVMHYQLPDNKEVMGLKVRYRNAQGEEVLRSASYACDSVKLIGFNEAQQGVEAFVTLCNRANVESVPVRVTFDTEDSGPVAFFESLEVRPGWNGFNLKWDVPEGAEGLMHVFYLGESPFTEGVDTLLIGSYAFTGGEGEREFTLQQESSAHTVVVRTEDFAGYMVREGVWEDVASYKVGQLQAEDIKFIDVNNLSKEDPTAALGYMYLFDGDTKGRLPIIENQYKTFLAGPDAIGAPFVFDLGAETQIAQVKMYCMLYIRDFPYNTSPIPYSDVWNGQYQNKLPCSVTIYGTNNYDDRSSWVEIGKYEEAPDTPNENRWCQRCAANWDYLYNLRAATWEELENTEPESFTINVSADEGMYRYLVLVVNDTYITKYAHMDQNPNNYVTFQELEIFAKVN